jgi:hypothetical protein
MPNKVATILSQTVNNPPPGYVIEGNPRILVQTTMGPQSLATMESMISSHGTKSPLCKFAQIDGTLYPNILAANAEGAPMPVAHIGAFCSCGCQIGVTGAIATNILIGP